MFADSPTKTAIKLGDIALPDDPSKFNWYNSIRLNNGTVLKGQRALTVWQDQLLPDRLDGKTVLDIGAADGGFSFQAEQRGASKVTACEQWTNPSDLGTFAAFSIRNYAYFLWAKKNLGSKVEALDQSFMSLPEEKQYDVVIFSQVLYHLVDPFGGMIKVRSLTRESCYLESAIYAQSNLNAMVFNYYPEIVDDHCSFWFPTAECVVSMCKQVKFEVVRKRVVIGNPVGRIFLELKAKN